MEGIVSEPVTALAARSDKAALSDLALAGSLLRSTFGRLDIIAGDYVHAPRERMKVNEAREGNSWRARMGS
jgi:hypothetical protein